MRNFGFAYFFRELPSVTMESQNVDLQSIVVIGPPPLHFVQGRGVKKG